MQRRRSLITMMTKIRLQGERKKKETEKIKKDLTEKVCNELTCTTAWVCLMSLYRSEGVRLHAAVMRGEKSEKKTNDC